MSKKRPRQGIEDTTVPKSTWDMGYNLITGVPHHLCRRSELNPARWESQVDTALWHAPNWQEWARCRALIANETVPTKVRVLLKWPQRDHWDAVRIAAYARDLRQYVNSVPSVRTLLQYAENLLAQSNAPLGS